MAKSEKDWETENAADTLLRAEEVKNKPALHKKALVILKARQTALAEVEGMSGAQIRAKRRNPKSAPIGAPSTGVVSG